MIAGPLDRLTTAQVVSRTLLVLAFALALAFLWRLAGFLLTPIALGLLIAYCAGPLVNLLEDRGLPRALAVAACFAAAAAVVLTIALAAWPSLSDWLHEAPVPGDDVFATRLALRMQAWEQKLVAAFPRLDWHGLFARLAAAIETQRKELMETVPSLALSALTSAGTFILAPVIALFILLDGAAMQKAVVALVPNRHFEMVLVLLHRVDRQIAAYLRGAASESVLVAILMSAVLWLAGMPKALLFGGIYGVANVIPIVGPLIGAGVGVVFTFVEPNAPTLSTLLVSYGVVYVIDAMFINPLVVGKSLNLHPLTIIVGISIGGHVAGILGMLVSIPLIAIGKAIVVTVRDLARARRPL
ncbi:MAG: AI-2E family transporter [Deltaproteobacteria bacterium]|nr:AI-2E family transporter [Deltaproteobacteria bacterium]